MGMRVQVTFSVNRHAAENQKHNTGTAVRVVTARRDSLGRVLPTVRDSIETVPHEPLCPA